MKNLMLALSAAFLTTASAMAETTTKLDCQLKVWEDDEWADCGTISLQWPSSKREEGEARGTGACSDFSVNFHLMESKKFAGGSFTIITARETKELEFAESTWMGFGSKMPPTVYLQPHFTDGISRSIDCVATEVETAQ